jgi:hypothetical protein
MTKTELIAQLGHFPDDANIVIVDEDGWHLEIRELVFWVNLNEITIRPVKEKAWEKMKAAS